MGDRQLIFRTHAIVHVTARSISADDVRHVIKTGLTIEDYPTDYPYPSRLVLGWSDLRPIHVVAADRPGADETIVITAHEPDAAQWEAGYRTRRNP